MTKKDKRLVKDKQKELANPNKVRKMKSFDLADDEQALNWLDLQRNQTASMKVLIDVAINLFGYTDLVDVLTSEMVQQPNLTKLLSAKSNTKAKVEGKQN